jgi:ribosomal protein RSM22 (predicted rRNA methylase)
MLEVCSAQGLQNITLSKKDGESYRKARKAKAGDAL